MKMFVEVIMTTINQKIRLFSYRLEVCGESGRERYAITTLYRVSLFKYIFKKLNLIITETGPLKKQISSLRKTLIKKTITTKRKQQKTIKLSVSASVSIN